ncbi:MAG: hypothetical protein C0403_03045 [Desulfobacterium sp.]|nr:hypothetical protein [Desulfobacterium sp.]
MPGLFFRQDRIGFFVYNYLKINDKFFNKTGCILACFLLFLSSNLLFIEVVCVNLEFVLIKPYEVPNFRET